MPNIDGKKTIGIVVNDTYEYKGKEVKNELDEFFQYIVDNYPSVFLEYDKFEKIKEILSW